MLPALAEQPLVCVTAIASRSTERARELSGRFGAAPVTGYARLLERADVEAVYVALPTALHAEWTLRALDAGKHVLCEKPFATDPVDARTAAALAEKRGLLLMEAFMFLHHGQHAAVRRMLDDGAIGDLRVFTAEFAIPALADGRPAAFLPDVAAHPIRAARLFLGSPLSVDGAHEFGALLSTPDGRIAHLTYGVDHAYLNRYRLWGARGSLTLDRVFSTTDDHPPRLTIEREGRTEVVELEPDAQFRNMAGAFAGAIRSGHGFAEHARDLLAQAELTERINRAAVRSTQL